jgi:phospholipase/carboxylesterase
VAGIVGYSGMLTGAAELGRLPISKPPVLLIHGSADPIVPVAALHTAKVALEKLGIEVSEHISTGLGHSVDPVGLRLGGEFAAKALSARR